MQALPKYTDTKEFSVQQGKLIDDHGVSNPAPCIILQRILSQQAIDISLFATTSSISLHEGQRPEHLLEKITQQQAA